MNRPSPLVPALIGGTSAAVASAIPIVNFLNCLCCALIIGGGFLAAFLVGNQHKKLGLPFGAADGAKVGALAGVAYGVVSGIINLIVSMLGFAPDVGEIIEQVESSGGEIPENMLPVIEAMAGGGGVLIGMIMGLVLGLIFCTVGGLIAGAVLKSPGASAATTIDA